MPESRIEFDHCISHSLSLVLNSITALAILQTTSPQNCFLEKNLHRASSVFCRQQIFPQSFSSPPPVWRRQYRLQLICHSWFIFSSRLPATTVVFICFIFIKKCSVHINSHTKFFICQLSLKLTSALAFLFRQALALWKFSAIAFFLADLQKGLSSQFLEN